MADLTDDQHTRLRELLNRGTPTPWDASYVRQAVRHIARNCPEIEGHDEEFVWDRYTDGNLIVEGINALPALLDENDRLRERIADLEQDNEGLQRTLAENDRLRRENDDLHDDVLRAITERNEVARLAAAEIHPGPDGEDDQIRRELIQNWMDEGRDGAESWQTSWEKAARERTGARDALATLTETVRAEADAIEAIDHDRPDALAQFADRLHQACARAGGQD